MISFSLHDVLFSIAMIVLALGSYAVGRVHGTVLRRRDRQMIIGILKSTKDHVLARRKLANLLNPAK